MWIKICANTSLDDARLASNSGADAVGYVFAPSRRRLTAAEAAAIAPQVPLDVTQIGVFQTSDFDEIASTVRLARLHGTQLHGTLDLSLIGQLRSAFGDEHFIIQTLHWSVDSDPAESERTLREELRKLRREGFVDAVLLDAKTPTTSGGTGRAFDWDRAGKILSAETGKLRIILAGGLNPANVTEAIRTLRPWGVDVASGVESQPGKKDGARLQAFIMAAREAFAAIENFSPSPR